MSQDEIRDTKQRILDAAEEFFAEAGFHATSLRTITQRAEANLAAVNYHFGSKEALYEAVILRRLEPLNASRLALLDEAVGKAAERGENPSVREIWRAMAAPTLQLREPGSGAEHFVTLVGRILSEPADFGRGIFVRHMAPLAVRVFEALRRALPGTPPEILYLRMHMAIGSLAHLLRCNEKLPVTSGLGVQPGVDMQTLTEMLLDFTVAGLEAAP